MKVFEYLELPPASTKVIIFELYSTIWAAFHYLLSEGFILVTHPLPSRPSIKCWSVDYFPSSYSCLCFSFLTDPCPLSGFPVIRTPNVVLFPASSSHYEGTYSTASLHDFSVYGSGTPSPIR